MSEIQLIAATVLSVARPGMKPKQLMAAVRESHPEATKKEIVRAAFFALTDANGDPSQAAELHSFAIGERGTEEEASPASTAPPKKDRKAARAARDPH